MEGSFCFGHCDWSFCFCAWMLGGGGRRRVGEERGRGGEGRKDEKKKKVKEGSVVVDVESVMRVL